MKSNQTYITTQAAMLKIGEAQKISSTTCAAILRTAIHLWYYWVVSSQTEKPHRPRASRFLWMQGCLLFPELAPVLVSPLLKFQEGETGHWGSDGVGCVRGLRRPTPCLPARRASQRQVIWLSDWTPVRWTYVRRDRQAIHTSEPYIWTIRTIHLNILINLALFR